MGRPQSLIAVRWSFPLSLLSAAFPPANQKVIRDTVSDALFVLQKHQLQQRGEGLIGAHQC
jgi:hypothetical protein